jgi:hypothetical protein
VKVEQHPPGALASVGEREEVGVGERDALGLAARVALDDPALCGGRAGDDQPEASLLEGFRLA